MARRWTEKEETIKRKELALLYIEQNNTISEVGKILNLAESSVYDRMIRLGIKPDRARKKGANNKRRDFIIPGIYSADLSEFIGILLGDGHMEPHG